MKIQKGKGVADNSSRPILITGGAGFVGTNVAHRYLSAGQPVILFDDLSRSGVERNVQWLQETHGNLVHVHEADIRDLREVRKAVREASRVFHFAAQVAVTTSLDDPIYDFEVNCRGTLNLLESIRQCSTPPPLIFTSTNKVYGDMHDVGLELRGARYEPADESYRQHGFSEQRRLDFHSPYGCSKGAACQYVLDYARTFKIPAAVFRMSCIYGPHQFGNEDQGWVAHFLIRAIERKRITIYGDGKQVRDILFVEDLVDAFELAQANIERISGQAFNIGGGPANTISLLELLALIDEFNGEPAEVAFESWRPADQRYYVSDTRKFQNAVGWRPKVSVREGVQRLHHWLEETWEPSGPVLHPRLGTRSAPAIVDGYDPLRGKAPRSKRAYNGGSSRNGRSKLVRTL